MYADINMRWLSDKIAKLNFSPYRIGIIAIITYGIVVRLCEYLANRSLWMDEAVLTANIVRKSFLQFITQPMEGGQAAPLGFLWLTKAITTVFGTSEYALRALPLICGIAAIFVFRKLLIKVSSKTAALIALALFSISVILVWHAAEFKQYSSDVLVFLSLLLWGTSLLEKKLTVKNSLCAGAIGAVAIWLSYPAVFALGAIWIVLFCDRFSRQEWPQIANLCLSLILWEISFVTMYVFSLNVIDPMMLHQYWADFFMPVSFSYLENQLRTARHLLGIFYSPGALNQVLLSAVAFVTGACAIYKKEGPILFLLLLPLALVWIASGLHQYPFGARLLLFYAPVLYLFIAEGLSFFIHRPAYSSKIIGIILSAAISWYPLTNTRQQLGGAAIYSEDIKPILNYVKNQRQKNDTIYVYYNARSAFAYYAPIYGFDQKMCIEGISYQEGPKGWERLRADLGQLKQYRRVWVIFSYYYFSGMREEKYFMMRYLDSIGTRQDMIKTDDGSAYLYEFSGRP